MWVLQRRIDNLTQSLARMFVDATVNKWGTEEEDVSDILRIAHNLPNRDAFEREVYALLPEKYRAKLGAQDDGGGCIGKILQDELSGTQLSRALDIYTGGSDGYRESRARYFADGLLNTIDMSSTDSKILLGVGAAGLAALGIVSAPAALVAGAVLVVGTAAYGIGKIVKNAVEIAAADTEADRKQNLLELGEGAGITALSAPFAARLGPRAMRVRGAARGAALSEAPADVISRTRRTSAGDLTAEFVESTSESPPIRVDVITLDALAERTEKIANAGGAWGVSGRNPLPEIYIRQFWIMMRTAFERGNYKDIVRPGLMNSKIPVRVIEMVLGTGRTRYSFQVKIDLMKGGIDVNAYVLRLGFNGDECVVVENLGKSSKNTSSVTPYESLRPDITNAEAFKALPPEEAMRLVTPHLDDFAQTVKLFIDYALPH